MQSAKNCTLHLTLYICSAEREGFEPPEACASTVFKTAAIDHSAISPGAKLNKICNLTNKIVLLHLFNRAKPEYWRFSLIVHCSASIFASELCILV